MFSLSSQLDQFELEVEAEFNQLVTGIFGVSGAGKTTLFQYLAGLKKGVKGVIRFNDVYWLDSDNKVFVAPEHRRIGYVPQNGLLFPNKNVRQNILIASDRIKKQDKYSDSKTVSLEAVCELLDLGGILDRSVVGLSGGERQRIALGRAICSAPDLLLLDEPLAALDLKLKRQILPFLYRIREELNIPMIMISHYPSEIQALCDDVLVLQEGKKIAFGPAKKMLLNRNVLELTQGEYYENVIPAVVLSDESNDRQTTTSLLAIGQDKQHNNDQLTTDYIDTNKTDNKLTENHETQLITAHVKLPVGANLMVGIPANDIIIATCKPEGLSAQNIISANVTAIEHINGKYMVNTTVVKPFLELNAEISADSLNRLGFDVGDIVYLVIKSSACILYQ